MPFSIHFKPIKAKKYQPAEVMREIGSELLREGAIEQRMFEKTTKTWRHSVLFTVTVGIDKGKAYVSVGTDDKIYGYLNDGVKARVITAKRKPYLVFRWPYGAKTKVRTIGSGKGSIGDNWARKRSVKWKGIKARKFAQEIQKRRQPYFPSNMQKAITKGLSRVQ